MAWPGRERPLLAVISSNNSQPDCFLGSQVAELGLLGLQEEKEVHGLGPSS